MELRGRELELATRLVKGIEKLAETPVLETEGGPPICPHCETLNPIITVPAAEESSGPLVEYYMQGKCENCGKTFYGVPMEWAFFTIHVDATEELSRRAGLLNGNGSN